MFKAGDRVVVPKATNSVWHGIGVVNKMWDDDAVSLTMVTGENTGQTGTFRISEGVHLEKEPEMIEPGTLMVITNNTNRHRFRIGETVKVGPKSGWGEYRCEKLDGSDFWYVDSSDMMPVASSKPEAYLCLCGDGCYIAHEGSLEDIPDYVTAVWAPGKQLQRKTVWSEV